METLGQDQGQGRRSPSPPPPRPPPPPHSDDDPLLSHRLAEEEQEAAAAAAAAATDFVNQEVESEAVASPPLPNDNEEEEKGAGEEHQEAAAEAAAVESGKGPAVLTDDLRDKIVRQVEYYFSDENLPTDKFMLKHVKKDRQGFVSLAVIASFRKMKRLVTDLSLIEAALRTSSQLVVSKDGRNVRRLHPLPRTEIKDTKSCTVIVENLPDDYSADNLQQIFAKAGKILNVTIHDPCSTYESKPTGKSEMTFSNKLHALIENETVKAAANAVATLNGGNNWRSGMRVKLLHDKGKQGLIHKGHKEIIFEKSNNHQRLEMASDGRNVKTNDNHDEKAEKEEEEHFAGGKGRNKNRYRARGRGQQNASGQGHGQVSSSCTNGVSRPPPGPRMPDGTRGFTMGRGKITVSEPTANTA